MMAVNSGPITRVCHVCGRQYGLSSFEIHLKQCKKLWITQEELKPKKERRPLPKTPPKLDKECVLGSVGGTRQATREEVEAMNRAAAESFNEHGMEKCENCGRTFAEGRLAIHSKSCRPGNVAKKIEDGAVPRNKDPNAVDYGRAKNFQRPQTTSTPSSPVPAENTSSIKSPTKDAQDSTKPLSGNLASNRKRSTGSANIQSPLSESSIGKPSLELMNVKLDKLEIIMSNALEELRLLRASLAAGAV